MVMHFCKKSRFFFYFTICEEYAKTGLPILKEAFSGNANSFVMDLEIEALRYYEFLENQREFF